MPVIFEKITPGTLAAQFCPWHTLYSWEQRIWEVINFDTFYYKMIEGFGRPVQWDEGSLHPPITKDLNNLWWVCHQMNSIYLTTEKQFIYCELVFGNIEFQQVEYGEKGYG